MDAMLAEGVDTVLDRCRAGDQRAFEQVIAVFSVDPGGESGTTLTRSVLNAPSDPNECVHVSGRWPCRSST